MNRAERRRASKNNNLKSSDIDNIKRQASKKAVDVAFLLMLAIPTMVIHDKYSQLMKKTVNGKSREERFVDLCIDLYDSFNKGYVSIEDFHRCLWEEAGVKIERGNLDGKK